MIKEREHMRILVVCNGGMSSSILTKKINKAAANRGIEVFADARSNSGLNEEIGKWDVCLVAPQIMYAVESVQKTLGIPVASIEGRVYAVADGEKVLDQALELIKTK